MARNRWIAYVDRQVLRTSIAGAAFCLVTFLSSTALRSVCLIR